ncbi:MAG TPA: histidinol-phosphatase HisJ family protein [Phycisphaerae bacterium]|nr:histidinol-phosphatase HisJ family protein [Phycisphaerae bacterium]HOB74231.1 histidinol-phosphatase HisJ family protein [Phycisphaerae bacterium]HOJ55019.1 histidinol-phosphatase HisJ family protein [Phycisphaerae bacterium]HOL26960.1 histidinol-phosphatase HisJ family protein [Phycisphaerae bacterium]HPP21389.1 histidinol-phosphatase HisJ family protein [Phycisphaerae bacterium]
MALYDQHLHSRFSVDSDTDPVENARQALSLGLAGLSITDHLDTHPTEWPICRYDYDGIAAAVAGLREQFGDRLFIGHGIEVCYQPEQMSRILPFVESHRFDIVLLSVHWFGGRALHVREHWDGLDAAAGTRAYLEAVLSAARFVLELKRQGRKPFDVLGHLDLVKRYTVRYFNTFEVRSQREIIDEILRTCLEAELVPEVNLSSLRQSLPEPMPADWVIRRYAELGGEAMTLGSDAHSPEHVGAHFKEGAAMLREGGIRRLAVFKDRCREDVDL